MVDLDRDDEHRRINYRLCIALDMTKLGMILDEMVDSNVIHPVAARTYRIQAAALLASIRQANDAHFGMDPSSPIL